MNADSKISSPAADVLDVTSGDINFYTNGRHMLKTQSSVMISSSPFLNDARIREWTATESLRRNGVDYPLLFGMMPLLEGIWASLGVEQRLYIGDVARSPDAFQQRHHAEQQRVIDAVAAQAFRCGPLTDARIVQKRGRADHDA